MRICFFLVLLVCTTFLVRSNGFEAPPDHDEQPLRQQQSLLDIQSSLTELEDEQLYLVIKTFSLGEVPEEGDLSTLPENTQALVQVFLEFEYAQLSLLLEQLHPILAKLVSVYRHLTAMERIAADSFGTASAQFPTFIDDFSTHCIQAHGRLTWKNETLYRTWFQDTLTTWFEQQYQERNALGAEILAISSMAAAEEEEEGIGMPPPPAQEESHGEADHIGDSDTLLKNLFNSISFEEVDPMIKALSHAEAWLTPDTGPDMIPLAVEQALRKLPEATTPAFRLSARKAFYDIFQLMMTMAYAHSYLAFLNTKALPPTPHHVAFL